MKKLITILLALTLFIVPASFVSAVGVGIGIGYDPGLLCPEVYMNPNARVFDANGPVPRVNNYAFTGESITWSVLVRNPNGASDIGEVGGYLKDMGGAQAFGVNCYKNVSAQPASGTVLSWAILENGGTAAFNPITDAVYTCQYTVTNAVHGEYWVYVAAESISNSNCFDAFDEMEFFFLNPEVYLGVSGPIEFGTIYPGQTKYSNTIWIKNDVEAGSGVALEMFISGTDFRNIANISALCPISNYLGLTNFAYFATKGMFSTKDNGVGIDGFPDAEGYDSIPYEAGDPSDRDWIIDTFPYLTPGAEIAVTFRLSLPTPCMGVFTDGEIYFWGEPV